MRTNILQQAADEVKHFKKSILTPEVLETKRPELKAMLEKEYDALVTSRYVQIKLTKMMKNRIDKEMTAYFESKDFKSQVHQIINSLFSGGINANK